MNPQIQIGKTAFWDVDINNLDETNHADFIITRVFQFGLMADLKTVLKLYDANQIKHAFEHTRGVDIKAIDLAKVLGYL
jgi:hypothetical protein